MGPGGPTFNGATVGKRPALVVIGAALTIIAIVVACQRVPQGNPTPEATPTPIIIIEPGITESGLVYFQATDKVYWDSLEAFYRKNPNLHCDYQGATEKTEVHGYGETRYAITSITGHILHCHDIAVDAQDITRE